MLLLRLAGITRVVTVAKTQRIVTWCGVVLVVLGVVGAIFAPDAAERDAQFLAIGMGAVALVTARVFLPWMQRRASQRR